MSFTSTREELALALSTVPGVTGHVRRPTVPALGDAWPLLADVLRGPGDSFQGTWRVLVFLGGDEFAATTWMDDTLPLLVAAIEPTAFVDSAVPIEFPVEGGKAYAVQITARSE